MDDSIKKDYYERQIGSIDFHSEYPIRIKIEGGTMNQRTKWMDINEISARVIVETLIKEFNLKIS